MRIELGDEWLEKGAPALAHHPLRTGFGDERGLRNDPARFLELWTLRGEWTRRYSFAQPCREAIEILARGPLVEIGAGTGYWAALITRAGGDIIATDAADGSGIASAPTSKGAAPDTGPKRYGHRIGRYHPVLHLDAVDAIHQHPDRDILLIWPCYERDWSEKALKAIAGGRTIHIIGEGAGGCTGNGGFHAHLDKAFDEIDHQPIPCWPGIRDHLTSWRKRASA